MRVHPYRSQYLLVVAADHEVLSRSIESFRKLFDREHRPNIAHEFDALCRLLDKKIPDHFSYEEKQVFPMLLADRPSAAMSQAIADLCDEHANLLQHARALSVLLDHQTLALSTGELWLTLLDFFEVLEHHAAKEDALFQPPPGP